TAASTAFPQPKPGAAPSPGPMKVPDDQLRGLLGVTDVNYIQRRHALAVIDSTLGGLRKSPLRLAPQGRLIASPVIPRHRRDRVAAMPAITAMNRRRRGICSAALRDRNAGLKSSGADSSPASRDQNDTSWS